MQPAQTGPKRQLAAMPLAPRTLQKRVQVLRVEENKQFAEIKMLFGFLQYVLCGQHRFVLVGFGRLLDQELSFAVPVEVCWGLMVYIVFINF